MKNTKSLDTSLSFMFFMMSMCLGFLGLFTPWSSAYFRTRLVGASMPLLMGHPLSFWQTSFFSLLLRQAPCRTWIVTQANTPQGSILNSVQIVGFFALSVLILFWLSFVWVNRKTMTQAQRKQLFRISLVLFFISAIIIVRMATFADCHLVQSIELLDIHFFIFPLFLCAFSMLFGGIAIGRSRTMVKEVESD